MTLVFVTLVRYADLPSELEPGNTWGDLRFVAPELVPDFVQQDLHNLDRLGRFAASELGTQNWGRCTSPLALGRIRGFLKQEMNTYRKNRLTAYILAGRYTTKSVQEFVALRWLRSHGITCPRPLALWTRRSGSQIRAALLLEELDGYVPLTEYLVAAASDGRLSPTWATRMLDSLAQFVVRFHNALVHNPDLFAWHVFVRPVPVPSPEDFAVIDLQRTLVLAWRPCCVRRARDLAALLATISDSILGPAEREWFLTRYMELARPRDPWRPIFPWVLRRRMAHLRARSKVREAIAEQDEALLTTGSKTACGLAKAPVTGAEVAT